MDWIREGEKFAKKRNLDKAIECFKKAYDESEKVREGESPQRIRAIALDNLGVIYAMVGKYKDALDCFDKSISFILTEKGIDKDPLAEGTEVPNEVWLKIIRDPLAYTCYGDKAAVLNDLALEHKGEEFNELIHRSRKILDKLLETIPVSTEHMQIASRLARTRYNLILAIAQRKYPGEFLETDKGILASIPRIKEVYKELGYSEKEIMFDFRCNGIDSKIA